VQFLLGHSVVFSLTIGNNRWNGFVPVSLVSSYGSPPVFGFDVVDVKLSNVTCFSRFKGGPEEPVECLDIIKKTPKDSVS